MGDAVVPLNENELRQIGDYLTPRLRELVLEIVPQQRAPGIDTQLLERMVRVEEELKSQRELMIDRFGFIEKRFELVEKRFEAVDNRFDDLIHLMDKRFESVDKRFDGLIHAMDKRFESVDKRFEDMQASFSRTQWLMGLGFVLITAAVTVFGLLA